MADNTNLDRLNKSSETILKFYFTKVPSLIVVNHQINELTKAKLEYEKTGSKDKFDTCESIIKALEIKRDEINAKTKKKNGKSYNIDEKKYIIENDEVIQGLYKKQKEYRDKLKDLYPTRIYNRLRELNRDIRASKRGKTVDVNKVDINYNNQQALVYLDSELLQKEYDELMTYISEHLGLSIDEISKLTESQIKTIWSNKFGKEVETLKELESKVSDKISLRRNELLVDVDKETNIVSLIDDVFDFDSDLDDNEIAKIKDIMSSSYISMATAIAVKVCKKYDKPNDVNDALSGALMALSETINKWFDDKERVGTLIAFGYMVGSAMYVGAERALIELSGTGAGISTKSNILSERKKAINSYRKYNKGSEILSDEMILSLIHDSELTALREGKKGVNTTLLSNTINAVSESDLSASVGGEDDDMNYWDIYENGESDDSDERVSEAVDNIKTLGECINKLMSYFKVVESVDSDGVVEYDVDTNVTMFDEIEKLIFFNYFGLVLDAENGVKDDKTYSEISAILAYETAKKEKIDLKHVKRYSDSFIGNKINGILTKIKIIVEADIDVKRALEYLYVWMRQNRNATFIASNIKEDSMLNNVEFDEPLDNQNDDYYGDNQNDYDDDFAQFFKY